MAYNLPTKTSFFEFRQNNSGGSFVYEEGKLSCHVWIEAIDAAHANARAQQLGIYFDGIERGMDCDCCGDRWYEAWPSPEETQRSDIHTAWDRAWDYPWLGEGKPHVLIHYIDGTVEEAKVWSEEEHGR